MYSEFRYWNKTIKTIVNARSIAIYGAGTMGRALKKCLSSPPYNLSNIECYIVRSMSDNEEMVEGLPVHEIAGAEEFVSSLILIALNGKYIAEAQYDLIKAGFEHLIPISFDGDEWTYIRGNSFSLSTIRDQRIQYLSDISKSNLHIYVAHSIFDRQLSWEPSEQDYEIPIQVGASLTREILYPIRDSLGEDNISYKNRSYCEMTGVYWAWKNDDSDYVGFSHYRRRFRLRDEQLCWITKGNTDVIVTEPILNYDSVFTQYAKDHDAEDWFVLLQGIHKLASGYEDAAKQIQIGKYYFAYNMFIMRREIFVKYCEFVFPILEYCETIIGSKEDAYQNRYIGFLAERMLSIFLVKNKELRITIADKYFIE